jgi:suppressor of ftsI
VLRSRHGVLRATLPVERRVVRIAGARVRAEVYRGSFPGPTLRVRPGDLIELRVVNRLGEPTNLHEHGFRVSPVGISDNVLRTMPAGTASAVRVEVPRDLPPGTYWYRAHFHGLAEEQIFSGLAGIIVVEGLADRLPRTLRHIPEHVLALKDVQVRGGAIIDHGIDSNAPTTRTVNSQLDPALHGSRSDAAAATREPQRRHLVPATSRRRPVPRDRRGRQPGRAVWSAGELVLPPGKRYDVLVRWDRPGTYRLRTLRMSTGPAGDDYPERELVTVRASGPAEPAVAWPRSLGPLPRLDHAHVDRVRHLTVTEQQTKNAFLINGRRFDATRVDQVVRLGATEEWVIRNASRELHPFHIHVNDFQVVSINGRPTVAAGVANARRDDARPLAQQVLHSPEAAARQDRLLGRLGHRSLLASADRAGEAGASCAITTQRAPEGRVARGGAESRDDQESSPLRSSPTGRRWTASRRPESAADQSALTALATRLTLIHEEGRTARCPRVLTDERG